MDNALIRVENNVGTEHSMKLHANNAGSYFAGPTYVQRISPTPTYGCPFNDPACSQQCPFGFGYSVGTSSRSPSQNHVNKIFTITAKTPCRLTVTPAPLIR